MSPKREFEIRAVHPDAEVRDTRFFLSVVEKEVVPIGNHYRILINFVHRGGQSYGNPIRYPTEPEGK
jgi:hypothetical protein